MPNERCQRRLHGMRLAQRFAPKFIVMGGYDCGRIEEIERRGRVDLKRDGKLMGRTDQLINITDRLALVERWTRWWLIILWVLDSQSDIPSLLNKKLQERANHCYHSRSMLAGTRLATTIRQGFQLQKRFIHPSRFQLHVPRANTWLAKLRFRPDGTPRSKLVGFGLGEYYPI